MPYQYEKNPGEIEAKSFKLIRQLTDLTTFSKEEQQVVMRIVHSVGLPEIAQQVQFSQSACEAGLKAISNNANVLCDVEMVRQGITRRMVKQPPLCFLNDPRVKQLAEQTNETRSMAALRLWQEKIDSSVVIIGNAPTALFRLLEMIELGGAKPALIIGMPVGFVGAAESKQALWDCHEKLGVECITLSGRQGGSAVSAATYNALLRCDCGEWY